MCLKCTDVYKQAKTTLSLSWIHQVWIIQTIFPLGETFGLSLDWFHYLFFIITWYSNCRSSSPNCVFHMWQSWIRILHQVHKNSDPDNCKTAVQSSRIEIPFPTDVKRFLCLVQTLAKEGNLPSCAIFWCLLYIFPSVE